MTRTAPNLYRFNAKLLDEPSSPAVPPTAARQAAMIRRRLPSVRVLITLIVVIPVVFVSVALIWIATITSRGISEQLGYEIVNDATKQVSTHIEEYLGSAVRVSNLYARRIENGLSTTDLRSWETTMFQDLATNPDIASICFATPNGDCTWLLRSHGRLELGFVNGNAKDRAIEYPAKLDGTVDREHPIRIYRYDANERPWYKKAMESSGPVWTPIYHWFTPDLARDETVTGTGYTRQVLDTQGKLAGVLIIDVTLGALSEHLRQLEMTRKGYAFIIDDDGSLVAASAGAVNSKVGKRLAPAESDSPAAIAIAGLVKPDARDANDDADAHLAGERSSRQVVISGQPARAQATQIFPFPGIHWHIVAVLPESSFLGKATSLQHRAIALAIGAVLGGSALGLLLSRAISRPLLRLTEHVGRVGAGDFDSQLSLGSASELSRLSDEVNRMAGGLKQRMRLEHSLSVATQVQQSLLPASVPTPRGLEVAACNRYCDSTGGDYYDFVDFGDETDSKTLVAVGDVTGHGIGAALLMATARGAVRASTASATNLGQILDDVNHVLTGHSAHGMFMTLSLVCVEPDSHLIRWASAGHDPSLVYHPALDRFDELAEGDVPLGIEPDVRYREFSRAGTTPGSIIVIGTDGIWEARNREGEMFGKHRLRELMRQNHESAEALSSAIKRAMYDFVGNRPLQDDVTFVVLKVTA